DTLNEGAQRRGRLDEADRVALARLANNQRGTASQTVQIASKLQQLVRTMDENRSKQNDLRQAASEAQKQLEQTADGSMRAAVEGLNTARGQEQAPQESGQQPANDNQQS